MYAKWHQCVQGVGLYSVITYMNAWAGNQMAKIIYLRLHEMFKGIVFFVVFNILLLFLELIKFHKMYMKKFTGDEVRIDLLLCM